MLTVQFIELIGPNSLNSAIAAGGSASPSARSAMTGWQAGRSTKRTQVRYSPTSPFQLKRGPVVGRMSKCRVKVGRILCSGTGSSVSGPGASGMVRRSWSRWLVRSPEKAKSAAVPKPCSLDTPASMNSEDFDWRSMRVFTVQSPPTGPTKLICA